MANYKLTKLLFIPAKIIINFNIKRVMDDAPIKQLNCNLEIKNLLRIVKENINQKH